MLQKKCVNLDMMRVKENNKTCATQLIKVPEEGLLAMVAAALKDRVLFPEKLESARKFMEKATFKITT